MANNPVKEILKDKHIEVVSDSKKTEETEEEPQPEDGTVEVPVDKFPDLKEGSSITLKVLSVEGGKLILATDREDDETKISKEIIADMKSNRSKRKEWKEKKGKR